MTLDISEVNEVRRLYTSAINMAKTIKSYDVMPRDMRVAANQMLQRLESVVASCVRTISRIDPTVVLRPDLFSGYFLVDKRDDEWYDPDRRIPKYPPKPKD